MNFIQSLHLITVILVILKLASVVAWSWWIILLPSIIALVIALIFGFFTAFIMVKAARKVNRWTRR